MSALLILAAVCFVAWCFDHQRTKRRQFQRGYDTAVVDCQIKRAQEDRARRARNGQWKNRRAKA